MPNHNTSNIERNSMRPVISRVMLLLLLGVAAVHAAAKETKVHGYVTNVLSPTQFEIEDYRVDRQTGFKLEFDNTSPELTFDPENLRVGVEVEVKGLYDPNTGVLNARSIKVDMEQFKKEKHTAVLAQLPQ